MRETKIGRNGADNKQVEATVRGLVTYPISCPRIDRTVLLTTPQLFPPSPAICRVTRASPNFLANINQIIGATRLDPE